MSVTNGRPGVDYAEFPDATGDLYISSKSAHREMERLMGKHGLSFTHNPGGGEFYRFSDFGGFEFRCQISTYDDVADLKQLRDHLTEQGLSVD